MLAPRRLWLLLLLLPLAPAAGAQEKFYRPELTKKFLDSTYRTDWYGVYLKDQKIGYVRNERKRDGGNIVQQQVMALKLASFGKKVDISTTQTLTFQPIAPHRMIHAKLVEKSGGVEKVTTFIWQEGEGVYRTVHEVAGEKRVELIKGIDYTLPDEAAVDFWVTQNPKVGAVVVVRSFDPTEEKVDEQTNKILSSKQSLAGGVQVHFYEVESVSKRREIKALNRYDDQGNTLSSSVAIFELRRETEEQVKDTQYSADLFVLGMVKIDKGLGRTERVAELVLEIGGKESDVFEDGPRQSVVTEDGTRLLRVGKKYGKERKATEEEIREALAETNSYPIKHPKVKTLADKVTAGARTDEEKVKKIVTFVHDYVKPSLSANAPNIHDLLEKKQGDCKSYALLCNNLCRAAGVPAREVSGLLYVGDDFKAFGGHAWNEVVLGGVWVPVDASMGETEVNATHLCLGTEHRATRNLLNSIGKLSFKLVESKSAK